MGGTHRGWRSQGPHKTFTDMNSGTAPHNWVWLSLDCLWTVSGLSVDCLWTLPLMFEQYSRRFFDQMHSKCIKSPVEIMWFCLHQTLALVLSPKALLTPFSVLTKCTVQLFHPEIFVFFLFVSSIRPLACGETCRGAALFSHGHYPEFLLGGRQKRVERFLLGHVLPYSPSGECQEIICSTLVWKQRYRDKPLTFIFSLTPGVHENSTHKRPRLNMDSKHFLQWRHGASHCTAVPPCFISIKV